MVDEPTWETFKDCVRASNRLKDRVAAQRKRLHEKYGEHAPYSVRQKLHTIDTKVAESERHLVELARVLVRIEDGEVAFDAEG